MMKWSMLSVLVSVLAGCASTQTGVSANASLSSPVVPRESGAFIAVDNMLEACVSISPIRVYAERNVALLLVAYEARKLVAQCGCKSPVIGYRVIESVDVDGATTDYERGFGRVLLAAAQRELAMVVASDRGLLHAARTRVVVGCAAAD